MVNAFAYLHTFYYHGLDAYGGRKKKHSKYKYTLLETLKSMFY